MHPASSILVFTTASGAGYGLLFLLGLGAPAGLLPAERWLGFCGLALALALISLGLAASAFHLRHPERAWRALSQWRSSWMSREGVMAAVTFAPAGLFALGWVVFETAAGLWGVFGLLASVCAAATVYCTGQIYASLKTIRQWHNPLTVPVYLAFAVMTGALWLSALLHLFALPTAGAQGLVLATMLLAWGLKAGYWRAVAEEPATSTIESATGLGDIGPVRLLDPPHTEENYLLHEFGYRVARKHARRLRLLAVVFGAIVPGTLTLLLFAVGGWIGTALAVVAALSGQFGALIERWLFFAEATHRVTLYYGAKAA